jgi:hypothetical protein
MTVATEVAGVSLKEVLASIITNATAAKNFILEETPDVINQLLLWHGVKSGIMFVLLLIIAGALFYFARKLHRRIHNHVPMPLIQALTSKGYSNRSTSEDRLLAELERGKSEDELVKSGDFSHAIATISKYSYSEYNGVQYGLAVGGVFMIFISTMCLSWLQILLAPKLYLLEYAAHLLS